MNILWVNHRDIEHPAAGGAERTIFEISRRLAATGHEVHLVTAGWRGASSQTIIEGVRVHRYPGYASPHLVLPLLLKLRSKPGVVIDDLAHVIPWGSPLFAEIPGTAFFRHLHARTLPGQVDHGLAKLLTMVEEAYPLIYRTWPFVTETRTSVGDLSKLGIPEARCKVIKPGVDTDFFKPGPKSSNPLLVYFGGMRRYKRPDHALRAVSLLKGSLPRCRLLVIGDGPELPRVRALADVLQLGSSVEFLGRVSRQRLAEILSGAWMNIHCSVAEGWGYSVLEAAASGVPTVAYRVPGLAETVVEGVSGLLVNDNDPQSLALAIAEIGQHIGRWTDGPREYASSFDWETAFHEWESHLMSLLGKVSTQ